MIDANIFNGTVGLSLNVDPRDIDGLINLGTMRASNGGILLLNGFGGGAFANTGGTISALDGSQVQLTDAASITGGVLSTSGTGTIHNLSAATLASLTNTELRHRQQRQHHHLGRHDHERRRHLNNSTGSYTDLTLPATYPERRRRGQPLQRRPGPRQRHPDEHEQPHPGETSNGGSLGTNEIGIVNRSRVIVRPTSPG